MPRVNFYLLPEAGEEARSLFACRLAESLQRKGMAVQIYASDSAEAEALDRLLWRFAPESFVPHAVMPAEDAADPLRVMVSHGNALAAAPNLLNLADEPPPSPERFETIAEFVANDDSARAQSRQRWQHYRDCGFKLVHHQL